MTYREARERAAALLFDAGIEDADNEARLLMEHVCGADLGFLLLRAGEDMPPRREEDYLRLTRKRCERIPLQHLTGEQEFMGLAMRVNGDVLIPRPETEMLAEAAVRYVKEHDPGSGDRDPVRVLDLCTGSGCIAVSVKKFCPEAEVSGSDISEKALAAAARNADLNGVCVNWIRSDLFDADIGTYSLIVCNPPYIPTEDIDALMPEVRGHDPRIALDGGDDGLLFYRRITDECGDRLIPGGTIMFEIGAEQGRAVAGLLESHGYENVEISKDLAGLDRIVSGSKPREENR